MTISNATNLWGPTQFIVDPVAAKGSYTTIQAAINAVNAAGSGTICIRPGIYTEDITLDVDCSIMALGGNGLGGNVTIIGKVSTGTSGSHSWDFTGIKFFTNGDFIVECLGANTVFTTFTDCQFVSSGAVRMINCTNGNGSIAFYGCSFANSANNGLFDVTSTAFGVPTLGLYFQDCNIINTGATTVNSTITSGQVNFRNCYCEVGTTVSATGLFFADNSRFNMGAFNSIPLTSFAGTVCRYCTFTGGTASAIQIDGSTTLIHCVIHSSNANAITGTSTLTHADLVFSGSSSTINPTVTQSLLSWKPYATAGNSGTAIRGTAGFDSTQFLSTDGFVQIDNSAFLQTLTGSTGGAISPTSGNINVFGAAGATTSQSSGDLIISAVAFQEVTGNTLTVLNNGYFASVNGITLTLPSGALVGDNVQIVAVDSPIIVQAQAGEVIQIGSSLSTSGGTATSTAVGNTLNLRYFATSGRWYCMAHEGTWTLA